MKFDNLSVENYLHHYPKSDEDLRFSSFGFVFLLQGEAISVSIYTFLVHLEPQPIKEKNKNNIILNIRLFFVY